MFTKKEAIKEKLDLYVWISKVSFIALIIFLFLCFILKHIAGYLTVIYPKENFHFLKEIARSDVQIEHLIVGVLLQSFFGTKDNKKLNKQIDNIKLQDNIEKEEGAIKNDNEN